MKRQELEDAIDNFNAVTGLSLKLTDESWGGKVRYGAEASAADVKKCEEYELNAYHNWFRDIRQQTAREAHATIQRKMFTVEQVRKALLTNGVQYLNVTFNRLLFTIAYRGYL